jgi:histone deacetylase 1/2
MRVFCCAYWPKLQPYNHHKIDFSLKTCFFIGYSLSHQGYKYLDLSIEKIYVSRHVIFNESFFLYKTSTSSSYSPRSKTNSLALALSLLYTHSLTFSASNEICQSFPIPLVFD